MSRLFINKLMFTGIKGESIIEFGERLTFISGPSDTGKSYIYKSIDYLLGAKTNEVPFASSIGYDTIAMEVRKGEDNITIMRKIGGSKITKINKDVKTEYTLRGKNSIASFYNELLDIPKDFKIPKNESGQTQSFSFRTMKSLFMVKEEDTESEKSILLPLLNQSETAFLSGLLFLLYEKDFSEYDPEENKKTKRVKKNAVEKYINTNISKLKADREKLKDQLSKIDIGKEDLESLITRLEEKLTETNTAINNLLNESRPLSLKILRLEDSIRNKKILINRYIALESQYSADIQRLGFIVEGEKILHNHKSPSNCPFCNNKLDQHDHESYLEASKAEVEKIILNSSDLSKTINDLNIEIEKENGDLTEIRNAKKNIEETINKQLSPQKISISKQITEYTSYIQASEKLHWINNLMHNFDSDLDNLEKTIEQNTIYKPKELFDKDFSSIISNNYLQLLKDINFKPADSVSFDMTTFDVIVNNQHKKTHGKGYRSLLNSLLILTMRSYINSVALKNPHFYLIDSPLHGLSMPHGIEDTHNVRAGFFDYLCNNYGDDQLIIIENINENELPEDIALDPKIKVIEFTQNENVGRYGLLEGIRKK